MRMQRYRRQGRWIVRVDDAPALRARRRRGLTLLACTVIMITVFTTIAWTGHARPSEAALLVVVAVAALWATGKGESP